VIFVPRINGSFALLIAYYLKRIGDAPMKLNWQATKIKYGDSMAGIFYRYELGACCNQTVHM
jgi:hypothetical protein